MSETTLTYEASVYARTVKYTNFKGKTQETELFFALDPLKLMQVMASFSPKKSKSGNPAKRNEIDVTDEEQVRFVRDLASKSAGFPSEDGESFEPFEDFENTLAGKAFLTQLISSDAGRREFAEKVLLDPFRAFVAFASADPSNTQAEIQQFKRMQQQMENVFASNNPENETLEDRKARLAAELKAIEAQDENDA